VTNIEELTKVINTQYHGCRLGIRKCWTHLPAEQQGVDITLYAGPILSACVQLTRDEATSAIKLIEQALKESA